MARVFISHSSRDVTLARGLLDWLQGQGYEQAFLDFDESLGIPAGARWEATLYEQVQRCQAMLLLLTPNWFESTWCFAEFVMARAAGKPVFPVIAAPIGTRSIATELQHVDLVSDRAEGLRRLRSALSELARQNAGGTELAPNRLPYPGLAAFEEADAAVYFGRAAEVAEVTERLEAARLREVPRALVVLGASGAGKSSLVRAGVLPRLKADGHRWWVLPPMRPRNDPLGELERLLMPAPAAGEDAAGAIVRALERGLAALPDGKSACALLTIDQGEELFTTTPPAACERFSQVLLRLVEDASARRCVRVLLTMRADHFGAWQAKESPLNAGEARLPKAEVLSLAPMPLERLSEVVEGPARVAGFSIGPGLSAAIAADAHGPDALPLVAFMLRELYIRTVAQRGRENLSLVREDYARMGEGAGADTGASPLQLAVRRRAQQLLDELNLDAAALQAFRAAFVEHLVNLDVEGRYTRRSARWEDLPATARPALDAFIDARLLVRREQDGDRIVEVAHEALLRQWPVLQRWLAEERDFLTGRRQIVLAQQAWRDAPPEARALTLLHGLLLDRAAEWRQRRAGALSADEEAFIDASLADRRAQAARARRVRGWVAGVAAVALVFAGTSAWSWWNGHALTTDLQAQRLVRLSAAAIEGQRADEALQLAVQAHALRSDYATRSALLQAGWALSPSLESAGQLPGSAGSGASVTTITWSVDGMRWLWGDSDGAVRSAAPTDNDAALLLKALPPDKNVPRAVLTLQAGAHGEWNAITEDGRWLRGGAAAGEAPRVLWSAPAMLSAARVARDGYSALLIDANGLRWVDCGPTGSCAEQAVALPNAPVRIAEAPRPNEPWLVVLGNADVAFVRRDIAGAVPSVSVANGVPEGQSFPDITAVAAAEGGWLSAYSSLGGGAVHLHFFAEPGAASGSALTTRPRQPLEQPAEGPFLALTSTADRATVAGGCGKQVCVWRAGLLLKLLEMLPGVGDNLAALAWSPDDKRLVAVDRGGRRLAWRLEPDSAGAAGRWLEPDLIPAPVSELVSDSAGQCLVAVAESGGTLHQGCPLAPQAPRLPEMILVGAPSSLQPGTWTARWDPKQRRFALAHAMDVWGWDATDPGMKLALSSVTQASIESLSWRSGGLAVGLRDGSVVAIPVDGSALKSTGPATELPPRHAEAVVAVADRPALGGKPALLLAVDTLGVILAHPGQSKPLFDAAKSLGHPTSFDTLAFSPDGTLLLAAGNLGDVLLVDPESGQLLARLQTGATMVRRAAFSRDGSTVAAVDNQQRLHLWSARPPFDPYASVSLRALPGHLTAGNASALGGLLSMAWLADGRLALGTNSGHVLLLHPRPEAWIERAQALRRGAALASSGASR